MAKSKTQSKRPVRARGTIPAPKVVPARNDTPWYRRRWIQIAGAVVLVLLLGIFAWQGWKARERTNELKKQVQRFERRINTLQASGGAVLETMNSSPTQFLAGQIPPQELQTQAQSWLEHFRKVDQSLRNATVPEELIDIRAQIVTGNLIYIDAAKLILSASNAPQDQRDELLAQSRNLIGHAAAVYGLGQRRFEQLKKDLGITKGDEPNPLLDQTPSLPTEEAPPGQPVEQGGPPGGFAPPPTDQAPTG